MAQVIKTAIFGQSGFSYVLRVSSAASFNCGWFCITPMAMKESNMNAIEPSRQSASHFCLKKGREAEPCRYVAALRYEELAIYAS